jgi:purine-binding chemotaxis protein CheW
MTMEIQNIDGAMHDIENSIFKVDDNIQIDYSKRLISTPERRKEILKSRALELAKEQRQEENSEQIISVVEFLLADEKFGIELIYIREIYPLKEITFLPCVPAFVLGIINARGQIISVINLKKFFDLPEKGLTSLDRILIINDSKMGFGVLADDIIGIRSIPVEEIQASLPTLKGIRDEYLKGITKDRLIILDIQKLLSDKKIIVNEEIE